MMDLIVKRFGRPDLVNELTGLIYDEKNFSKTLTWLKAHNRQFQQLPDDQVAQFIWNTVKERADAAGPAKADSLEGGLGIFWVINDAHAQGYSENCPEFFITFFVRLGRPAALEVVRS